jgi:hypothetical protein
MDFLRLTRQKPTTPGDNNAKNITHYCTITGSGLSRLRILGTTADTQTDQH